MINRNGEKGQLMLLSVLLISSAVLGATTVASLLVLFQLRQASDAKSSAQAVFAVPQPPILPLNYCHHKE